jgi:hypothetical protein
MAVTNITYVFLKTLERKREDVTIQPSTALQKWLGKVDLVGKLYFSNKSQHTQFLVLITNLMHNSFIL